ncbi:MAG: PIN domain-containing protein [Verrucomicrobiota bacterium]|jgi:predicted nucleic acid-binding protein
MGPQEDAGQTVKVIVDTCVWTRFLRVHRQGADPYCAEVAKLVRADSIQLIGPIRQELLSGAQPQERFSQLKEYLRFYPNLVTDEEDDENAAAFYNVCRSKGVQGTSTDLLICAVAVRYRMRILTTDTDFVGFAKYLPIVLHEVREWK